MAVATLGPARSTISFTSVAQWRTVSPLVPLAPARAFPQWLVCQVGRWTLNGIKERRLIQAFSPPLHHVLSLLRWSH